MHFNLERERGKSRLSKSKREREEEGIMQCISRLKLAVPLPLPLHTRAQTQAHTHTHKCVINIVWSIGEVFRLYKRYMCVMFKERYLCGCECVCVRVYSMNNIA